MCIETYLKKDRTIKNLELHNEVIFQKTNTDNLHNRLLTLLEDDYFKTICIDENKDKIILYLADKNILQLSACSDNKMQIDPVVAFPGVEVLVAVTVVAIVTPFALWVVRESNSAVEQTSLYTSELNNCMQIINKYCSQNFSKEMYKLLLSFENGEPYSLDLSA